MTPTLLAHGGTGGLIVESAIVVAILAVAIAIWVANRGKTEEEMEELLQSKIDEWTNEKR